MLGTHSNRIFNFLCFLCLFPVQPQIFPVPIYIIVTVAYTKLTMQTYPPKKKCGNFRGNILPLESGNLQLFPVQWVAVIVASRVAAFFFLPHFLLFDGKKLSILGKMKKKKRSPVAPFLVTRPLHRKHIFFFSLAQVRILVGEEMFTIMVLGVPPKTISDIATFWLDVKTSGEHLVKCRLCRCTDKYCKRVIFCAVYIFAHFAQGRRYAKYDIREKNETLLSK